MGCKPEKVIRLTDDVVEQLANGKELQIVTTYRFVNAVDSISYPSMSAQFVKENESWLKDEDLIFLRDSARSVKETAKYTALSVTEVRNRIDNKGMYVEVKSHGRKRMIDTISVVKWRNPNKLTESG